ncbi:5'-3' exoribonuclease 1 [Smittium culicis]|uniref:5'-3' exoribonuclease 1 n=1 Tax=Smittium culicis TaxID=133412 RepID=A0A1R1XU80_9FUNG|nr:5'-3' exoribonuclease 1 [Smittium culicis]
MGVPRLYGFLKNKYPLIINPLEDDYFPKYDNLYVDLNGIIYDQLLAENENEIIDMDDFEAIEKILLYIERLVSIINPRKLLFIAVDGVSPQLKLNLQRRYRYTRNKEKNYSGLGFDIGSISPGTEFMEKLNELLKFLIHKKVTEDKSWKKLKVVLSGYNVNKALKFNNNSCLIHF